MPHNFSENVSVLRRWAAHGGDTLPSDWETFERSNTLAAVELQRRDPELVSLLNGTAKAALVADALSGKLSSTPPDFVAVQRAAEADRTAELMAKLKSGEINLTESVELENRAPEGYAAAMASAGPSPEQVRAAKAQQAAALEQRRLASKKQANANMRNTARAQGLWG